ncbi:MAG: threonine/serine dehydratase [Calditrichaeota bacterium]|nr:MAG: threonine/serine dehydratase [Calditrichota bacterium]
MNPLQDTFDIPIEDIKRAQYRVTPYIWCTPLQASEALSRIAGSAIFLKMECWQKTGSFKIRGALNKMLTMTEEQRKRGFITASAGNHGLGVAYSARRLGIKGKIVVPRTASPAKVTALQYYGVEIIQIGQDYDAAEEHAWHLQQQEGLEFIHAFSDPAIIAGQGTIGLEIMEASTQFKSVLVPVGGGGLISGIAVAIKSLRPEIKIIGIQSEASPTMYNSMQKGRVVETPIGETIADGLAGRLVTSATLQLVQKYVDEVVLVSEEAIKQAMGVLLETEHILVEGSAAVGMAAILEKRVSLKKPCALILTGRNVDMRLVTKLLGI